MLRENLEIVGEVPINMQAITAKIKHRNPDVVIINDDVSTAGGQLIVSLLKTYPDLRIITFSLKDNHINVYDYREVLVTATEDLVTAITKNK